MKSKRQKQILEIIEQEEVETQEELAERLRERGTDVTQATVSRDIKDLHLIKIPSGDGRYKYALPLDRGSANTGERLERMLKDSVLYIDYSENLIVVKMLPGTAQGLASIIDNLRWKEIIGTVAGDDTIFLVVKPKEAVEGLMLRLKEKMF